VFVGGGISGSCTCPFFHREGLWRVDHDSQSEASVLAIARAASSLPLAAQCPEQRTWQPKRKIEFE
jgi:hypothetical protein